MNPSYEIPIVEAFEDWREYERLKAEWIADHPDATPAEYTAAVSAIARECGV